MGIFVPSHFHCHVVNPRLSRCYLFFYEYLKPVNFYHFIIQYFKFHQISISSLHKILVSFYLSPCTAKQVGNLTERKTTCTWMSMKVQKMSRTLDMPNLFFFFFFLKVWSPLVRRHLFDHLE